MFKRKVEVVELTQKKSNETEGLSNWFGEHQLKARINKQFQTRGTTKSS